jgi:hypothetical protein
MAERAPRLTRQVARDLRGGRITPKLATFLGHAAEALLAAGTGVLAKARTWHVSGTDRELLQEYIRAADRPLARYKR